MKVMVVSDTHGRNDLLRQAIGQEAPIGLLIHAGDIEGDLDTILGDRREYDIKAVAGNMDWSPAYNAALTFTLGKHKVFLTHGHHFGVHYGMEDLLEAARKCGADRVFYGHTHIAARVEEDGVLILNPGSLSKPRGGADRTYLVFDVDDETGEWSELRLKKLRKGFLF